MTEPEQPMEADDPLVAEHNAFFEALPPEAKERFLEALTRAADEGASEQAAWEQAVVAAELTY